jgi:cytochrome c553
LKPNLAHRFTVALLAAVSMSTVQAASFDERLTPCFICHGENGQSLLPAVPSLGGQPVFFLTVQMLMFCEKMRDVEPMTAMMKSLERRRSA